MSQNRSDAFCQLSIHFFFWKDNHTQSLKYSDLFENIRKHQETFAARRTETHFHTRPGSCCLPTPSHTHTHTQHTCGIVQLSLHMDTSSSIEGMAKSRIFTQEFCICGGEVTNSSNERRGPLRSELSRSRTAGSPRDSHTERRSKQARLCQWLAPNPCASSRLSASTSMDTTWWPGIMARPRTLGSPWENVSEDKKG